MSWFKKLFGANRDPQGRERFRVELPPAEGEQQVYGDQVLRKAWAEDVLRAEGVPINPHLPMIESAAIISARNQFPGLASTEMGWPALDWPGAIALRPPRLCKLK